MKERKVLTAGSQNIVGIPKERRGQQFSARKAKNKDPRSLAQNLMVNQILRLQYI
jgi:hypothetical protein